MELWQLAETAVKLPRGVDPIFVDSKVRAPGSPRLCMLDGPEASLQLATLRVDRQRSWSPIRVGPYIFKGLAFHAHVYCHNWL